MMLNLKLLGGLSIAPNNTPVTGRVSQKAEILLAYLAMQPRKHSREVLATLLWEDSSQEQSLANLRTLLAGLKKHFAAWLLIAQKTVSVDPAACIQVDALLLLESLSAKDLTANIPQTEQALEGYQGEFLAGVYPRNSRQLEEWIQQTRDELHQRVLLAHQQLADYLWHSAQYARAIPHAHALLRHEPTNEAHHRLLIKLLARSGQREAALAQYETCARLLDEQIGAKPEPETAALLERLNMPSTHILPAPETSFVGRQEELAKVCARLRQPDCRLLTVSGLGGSGKTRLALETARHLQPDFLHGAVFVGLNEVERIDYLAVTIAETLQFPLRDETEGDKQLHTFLRQKEILLVLDNCEHLLTEDSAPRLRQFVDALLAGAPQVKLLLTSRLRLGLRAEWLVELKGLRFDAERLNPAVELFAQRARSVVPGFELGPDNHPAVLRICEIVEGLPLGIELAAAWTRSLTCTQIAELITENIDILSTQLHDIPERQRSLRAVFDHAWAQLDSASQTLAARLGVFRSSFDLEAVSAVAKAPPWIISNLVEKSLLHMAKGRYRMIEALQAYVLEKLKQDPKNYADTLREHSAYYLKLLHQHRFKASALHEDINNLRAVWLRLTESADCASLELAVDDFCQMYIQRGMFHEYAQMLSLAIERLPECKRALGRLYAMQAHILNSAGNCESAYASAEKAIRHGQETEDPVGQAQAYLQEGRSLARQDKYAPALLSLEKAMSFASQNQLATIQAGVWRERSVIAVRQHHYEQAREACQQALKRYRELGDRLGEGSILNNLGAIAWYDGNLSSAKIYFEQDLAICREMGDVRGENQSLGNLGYIAVSLGQTAEAERLYREVLEGYRHFGDRFHEASTLSNLAGLAQQKGNYHKMKSFCEQAIPISRETSSRWLESNLLATLGTAYEAMGAYETALAHVRSGLKIKQEIEEKYGLGMSLMHASRILSHLGNFQAAILHAQDALELGREVEDDLIIGEALTALGQARLLNGDIDQAQNQAEAALKLWQDKEQAYQIIDTRMTLAWIALSAAKLTEAQEQVNAILDILQSHPVSDTYNTPRLYLVCLQSLQATEDERFAHYTKEARDFVQSRADEIKDPKLRQSYQNRAAAELQAFLDAETAKEQLRLRLNR